MSLAKLANWWFNYISNPGDGAAALLHIMCCVWPTSCRIYRVLFAAFLRLGARGRACIYLLTTFYIVLGVYYPNAIAAPTKPNAIANGGDGEIVYIDGNHQLRVLDTHQVGSNALVEWQSPAADGIWRDFVLGDVNHDGEFEIIAIGGDGADSRLKIYDPATATEAIDTADTARIINGIPWAPLYEISIPYTVTLVAVGDLTLDTPGQEIIYGYDIRNADDKADPADAFRLVVLKQDEQIADGTQWVPHIQEDFPHEWLRIATGNVDDAGTDEVALVSDEGNRTLAVYRIDNDQFDEIFKRKNTSSGTGPGNNPPNLDKIWQDVAIGQYRAGGGAEVAAVRYASLASPSYWVFAYDDGELQDYYSEEMDPSPRRLFTADVNGNGDAEVFLLRSVPANVQRPPPRPRLILRNSGDDEISVLFELDLDNDSGYRYGAGGDIDSDGKDEVVVIRDNKISVYLSPDSSVTDIRSYELTTNRQTVAIGDLDKDGYMPQARLHLTANQLEATLPVGLRAEFPITVTNVGFGGNVPITVQGDASWGNIATTSNELDTTVIFTFDAAGLSPGVYTSTLVIATAANDDVLDDQIEVPLVLTVEYAFSATPAGIGFVTFPCQAPFIQQTKRITIIGDDNQEFEAVLDVEWATVQPTIGTAPATLSITVDPNQLADSAGDSELLLHIPGFTEVNGRISVHYLCADHQTYLPVLAK